MPYQSRGQWYNDDGTKIEFVEVNTLEMRKAVDTIAQLCKEIKELKTSSDKQDLEVQTLRLKNDELIAEIREIRGALIETLELLKKVSGALDH